MSDLVQIEKGWQKRRLKETGDIFEAKKIGAFYLIKSVLGDYRHLAAVVENLSEEVKSESPSL